jgi:uncharacterized protein YydD (DUF2326 family)
MGKELSRIKLNRLYSENNIFDEIIFHDGINLILGEKYDDNTVSGRKTNGVGKSMSIEFLNFCLLNDYTYSRLKKIPEDVVAMDENIILDMEIGSNKITISRNRSEESTPKIFKDGKVVSFDKISEAKSYLSELIFLKLGGERVPSFRNLLSILIRDEKSEFKDILKCYDLTKRIPDDLTVHLFFLFISLEAYKTTQKTIKEINDLTKVIRKNKNDLTENKTKKIPDVKAELNSLDDELKKMELAIDNFKTNEAFNSFEKDLITLEGSLNKLRKQQKVMRYEYKKIKSLPKPEVIDDSEIELVYNQFKENLGGVIVKSLTEVNEFKNKVENFQRVLINEKGLELEEKLEIIAKKIRTLDEEYSEKMKIIDQKGVLKNLKISLKIYEEKKSNFSSTKFLFDEYGKNEKQKKTLGVKKSQNIIVIDGLIEENKKIIDSFQETLLTIHEAVMGNKECSFTLKTVDKATVKTPLEMNMRIYDDGSHSVNRTKVFIYDMALLFNNITRKRHPSFLVHDNIFDVDQDTMVQSLNYLAHQEENYQDFQYILTLNRDKIENEENKEMIKLNIENHKVATFTKDNKFLRKSYQEI